MSDSQDILVGQIWAFTGYHSVRSNSNHHLDKFEDIPTEHLGTDQSLDYVEFAVEIISISNDVSDDYVIIKVIKAEGGGYVVGPNDKFSERIASLRSNYSLLVHTFENVGDVTNICVSCKRDCPFAKALAGFKCWGCSNGY